MDKEVDQDIDYNKGAEIIESPKNKLKYNFEISDVPNLDQKDDNMYSKSEFSTTSFWIIKPNYDVEEIMKDIEN